MQANIPDGSDLDRKVEAILGRSVPPVSEARSCAVESLAYAAEAEALFDRAETLPPGVERTTVLQDAHDAMRAAADWEQQARELLPRQT